MKVSVLSAPRMVTVQDRPIPEPAFGEVRIKVAVVGVCGSDVHYYVDGRIGSAVVNYPTVLGHEPAGIIDAVGEGVTSLRTGMRVAVEPASPCMHCEHCLAGRHNICPSVVFLGTPPHDGIFMEYRCMPAHCCIPLPEGMSLVEGALLEPLGVGLHAAALAKISFGETVAVFGSGPIGLCTMMAARLAGAKDVYMTDLIPERVAHAKALGATDAVNAAEVDVVEWLAQKTGGRGVDVAFEAAGQQQTVTQACETVRIGGRAFIIGIPSVDEFTIPMHVCRRKELLIQQVRRANGEVFRSMAYVSDGRIPLKQLATHTFSLDEVPQALELVHAHRDGVIRAMVLPHGDLDT